MTLSRILRVVSISSLLSISAIEHGTAAASADYARNWPQWRGPQANGVAPEGHPPTSWSETSNVKWKAKIPGYGTSTPIIWGDQVFIQTAVPTGKKAEPKKESSIRLFAPAVMGQAAPPADGNNPERQRRGGGGGRAEAPDETQQFTIISFDRQTGKILWQKVAREEVPHEGHHRDHGFASASPITDGKRLLSYFGSRGLHCYDLKGNLQWQTELGKMRTRNAFGEGSSPALHGDTVVVNWDHEGEDFIVAFDANNGKELWRQKRDEPTSWSTPLIVEHEGKAQVVVNATTKMRSYDLKTGKLNWECGGMTVNAIPSPVTGHGMVYSMSGFRGSSVLAIKLGRSGDLTSTDAIAWSGNKSTPYVPSPLLYDDLLYFFAGNNATLSCLDAKTGKAHLDAERINGIFGVYASPVGAAGRVYLTGRDGGVVVIKQGPKLEVLATNKLDDKFDASPAIVGNDLFLRGHEHLYCLAEK